MRRTGKQIISGLICLLLLTALLPLPAAASAKVLDSGTCGSNVRWALTDDGTLTISGTGPMRYFYMGPCEGYNGPDAPWYRRGSYAAITKVVIENGVTSIGGYAFYHCPNLTKVTIPESVTSIDQNAFEGCPKLSHITIPESITKIDTKAFADCAGLTSITFLGDAPSIGGKSFQGVTATVYFPCSKAWNSQVKQNYSGTLTWTGHVYSDYVIYQAASCTGNALATGTCPDCGDTADIVVPESATGHCFDQNGLCTACSERMGLTIGLCGRPKTGMEAPSLHVYADGTYLDSVGIDMFMEYNYESYVQKTLTYNPHKTYTFKWWYLPIYDSVYFAIFLGDRVLSCGEPLRADEGQVYYTLEKTGDHQYEPMTTPPTCTEEGFITGICTVCGDSTVISITPATGHSYTSKVTTAPTCTGEGERALLCSVCGASDTESVPATGHHYDADGLCVDCGIQFNLTVYMTDTYGDSWNGSAIEVYTGDTLLTEVSLPSGILNGSAEVPYVPGQLYQLRWKSSAADSECGFKITLNGEMLASGQGSSCTDGQILCTFTNACAHVLSDVTVTPPSCTEEGYTTGTCTVCGFSGIAETSPATGHSYVDGVCTVCHEIQLIGSGTCGDNLQWQLDAFGTLTISGTGPMENHSMPEGGEPDTHWYPHRQQITKVVIGDGVTAIGEYAFHSCTELTEVSIPETVTAIGKLAFYNCTGLTEIALPEGLTTIGNAAFRRCSNLTAIAIPDSITAIGKITFFDCTALTEVTISESVATIGEYAFGNCTALNSITFQGDAPTMNSTCFKNVTATANHPCNETWTDTAKQNYGGMITWKAVHRYENGFCTGCERRLPGDVTGDGKLNIMDVARLYAHIKGTGTITDLITLNVADFTGDGKVNILDIVGLYAHIKG